MHTESSLNGPDSAIALATSWSQREALRGVRKTEFSAVRGGRTEVSIISGGKRALMYGSVAAWISSGESRSAKSKTGLRVVSTA